MSNNPLNLNLMKIEITSELYKNVNRQSFCKTLASLTLLQMNFDIKQFVCNSFSNKNDSQSQYV
jgi:hypothetical protein